MATRKLTERQQRFAEAYAACGNASQAARQAGYSIKTAEWIGPRLVSKSHVAAAIAALARKRKRATIANLDERHAFLSTMMRDKKEKATDRVRACEVLMRANGEFASVAIIPPAGAGAAVISPGGDGEAPIVTIYMPSNGRDTGR